MSARGEAPEEIIRAYLEEHGPVELERRSLELTWSDAPLDTARRRRAAADLDRAGVVVEPPLSTAGPRDVVRVSLASRTPRDTASASPPRAWLMAIPLAVMVIGALGPWAENVFPTDQGTDRSGWIVVAAGALGTLLLAVHAARARPSPLPVLAALAGAAAAALVASDFRDFVDDSLVSPAWGLYVTFAGCALLVALSMALLVRR